MDSQRDGKSTREVKKLGAASFLLEFASEGKTNMKSKSLSKDFHPRYIESSSNFQESKSRLNRLSKRGGVSHDSQLTTSTIGTIDHHAKIGAGVTNRVKEGVIFTESPLAPGVPVVYRTQEEKLANPDRLNLDRKRLTICPVIEGEEELRLLNLQHNAITRLQHMSSLRRLVFLDLYDNLVTDMSGLEGLYSLRVLMLGRNRIHHISGLQSLTRLDVLDLHGNMIRDITNLDHLSHLRVLNLAGNDISVLEGVSGLQSLSELNFRRNRITQCKVTNIPKLQRLYLSHNLIESLSDIACLSSCKELIDLSIDGNPLANSTNYRIQVLSQFSQLAALNQSPFTEDERRDSLLLVQKEEHINRELCKKTQLSEERMTMLTSVKDEWGKVTEGIKKSSSYYIDKVDGSLSLYGVAAISNLLSSSIDLSTITSLSVHYIDVTDLMSSLLVPVKDKLVKLKTIELGTVNMKSLISLKHFAESLPSSVTSVAIVSNHTNPVTDHTLYKEWVTHVFRGIDVKDIITDDSHTAQKSDIKCNEKLRETMFGALNKLESAGVNKCKKPKKESLVENQVAGMFTDRLRQTTMNTYHKQLLFEEVWPGLAQRMINETLEWTYKVLEN